MGIGETVSKHRQLTKRKPSMPSNKFALKAFSFYEKIYKFCETK